MLRRLLTLIGAVVLSTVAQAGDTGITVGAHLRSWHSQPGYNNDNPGLYIRSADGWTAGTYRNSERRQSTYAGRTLSTHLGSHVEASLTLGAITGYRRAEVLPLVVPSLRIGSDIGLRIAYLPPIEKTGSHVVHIAAEWRL
jgi:hypothetical protein